MGVQCNQVTAFGDMLLLYSFTRRAHNLKQRFGYVIDHKQVVPTPKVFSVQVVG